MPKANNCPAGTVYSYDANGVPGCNPLPDALSRAIFSLTCPSGTIGSFGSDGNMDCIASCQAPNTLAYNDVPGYSTYNPTGYTYCKDASGNPVAGSSTEINNNIGPGPPQGGTACMQGYVMLAGKCVQVGPEIIPTPITPGPTLPPAPVTAGVVNTLISDLQGVTSNIPLLLALGVGAYLLLKK